jgi:hypothetical protein
MYVVSLVMNASSIGDRRDDFNGLLSQIGVNLRLKPEMKSEKKYNGQM